MNVSPIFNLVLVLLWTPTFPEKKISSSKNQSIFTEKLFPSDKNEDDDTTEAKK